jgi:hypothetical protein
VASGELWTRLPGQGSWKRTSGTGQPGQDSRVRTGHLREDIWDRTTVTGQRDILTGQAGLTGNLDRTERTGQPGRPGHDNV